MGRITYRFTLESPLEFCNDCPCFEHEDKGCQVLNVLFVGAWNEERHKRPDFCPLVHMKEANT